AFAALEQEHAGTRGALEERERQHAATVVERDAALAERDQAMQQQRQTEAQLRQTQAAFAALEQEHAGIRGALEERERQHAATVVERDAALAERDQAMQQQRQTEAQLQQTQAAFATLEQEHAGIRSALEERELARKRAQSELDEIDAVLQEAV